MRRMASLIRELARRRRRREQERQLGHAMPALDEENDGGGAEVAVLPLPGNVCLGRVKNTAGGLSLRVCWFIQFHVCVGWCGSK